MVRHYNYINDRGEIIGVMRCEAIYENDREYTVACFCKTTGQYISKMTRSFHTANEAQFYLDNLAYIREWAYAID